MLFIKILFLQAKSCLNTVHFLRAKTKKNFLEALTEIILEIEATDLAIFNELRDRIHLMSNEDFGYFVVLLKFDFAYQERNS